MKIFSIFHRFLHLSAAFSPGGLLLVEDAMEVVFGSTWVQLNEMPDEEATAVLKMTVSFAKFVQVPGGILLGASGRG